MSRLIFLFFTATTVLSATCQSIGLGTQCDLDCNNLANVYSTMFPGQTAPWVTQNKCCTETGPGLITCQVNVDACSESRIFQVTRLARARNEEWVCDLNDPFDQLTLVGEQDRRVALSAKVLKTLLDDRAVRPKWSDDSIYLWTACLGRGHS